MPLVFSDSSQTLSESSCAPPIYFSPKNTAGTVLINGYFNLNTMGGFEADQTALINLIPQPYTNPLALFEYEIDDMTAIFIDLSEFVNETQISSWNWNFGDGSSCLLYTSPSPRDS